MTYYCWIPSPVGQLFLAGSEAGLKVIDFSSRDREHAPVPDGQENQSALQDLICQLESYFAGKLKVFSLPLAPQGTPFQMRVWRCLQGIPYGQTMSYGRVARQIGKPNASRAVGAACGRNPLSIVIPCHRVIGSTGKLTGFGGGLNTKQKLLALEQGNQAPARPSTTGSESHAYLDWYATRS